MGARRVMFLGWLLLAAASACGDDKPAPISGISAGGDQNTFCRDYCVAIVANGADCAHYNDNRRCEEICGFYREGGCADLYTPYAECNKGDPGLSCFLASSGKWGITVSACDAEYGAFNACIAERDAGVCPY